MRSSSLEQSGRSFSCKDGTVGGRKELQPCRWVGNCGDMKVRIEVLICELRWVVCFWILKLKGPMVPMLPDVSGLENCSGDTNLSDFFSYNLTLKSWEKSNIDESQRVTSGFALVTRLRNIFEAGSWCWRAPCAWDVSEAPCLSCTLDQLTILTEVLNGWIHGKLHSDCIRELKVIILEKQGSELFG